MSNAKELQIKGDWNQIKGKIKEKYATLTDNDLAYKEGQEDQMIGEIQKKTGETKQNIIDFINSL